MTVTFELLKLIICGQVLTGTISTTTTSTKPTTTAKPSITTVATSNMKTSATSTVTTLATLNTTTTAAPNSTSPLPLVVNNPTVKKCGQPPAISAGTSVVVRNISTYSCNAGYTLGGNSSIYCVNGTWTGDLPHCKARQFKFENKPKIFNQIESMPLWLMILLGAVLACAVLLLLCCMLAFCLKLLGCQPSSKRISEQLLVNPSNNSHSSKISTVKHEDEAKVIFTEEIKENPDKFVKLTNHGVVTKKESTPLPPRYAAIEKERKKAKKVNKWMPHKRQIREVNTSTK